MAELNIAIADDNRQTFGDAWRNTGEFEKDYRVVGRRIMVMKHTI